MSLKMSLDNLIKIRRNTKLRKPAFIRQDADKKSKLGKAWRKPKGVHSKLRHKFKGHGKMVEVGFGSPKEIRGFSRQGLKQVLARNVEEMNRVNPENECAVIASVGMRNKMEIVKKAVEKKIQILNIKNPEKWLEEMEQNIAEKKSEKTKKEISKNEKSKEREKKSEKTIEKKIEDSEEKKKQEIKEAEKIITKKEV